MKESDKTRLLVIGPLPPPYGGYVHVVSSVLRAPFTETFDLVPYDTKLHARMERGSMVPVVMRAAKHIAGFARARMACRPDAVLLFTGLTGCFWRDLFLLRQCHSVRLPTIVRFFGGDATLRMTRLPAPLQRLALKQLAKASAILVETEATACDIERLIPAMRVYRVPNFIHGEDVSLGAPDTQRLSRNGVIYLGSMTPDKGVELILSSVDQVCDYQRVPFHFVGGEVTPGYLDYFRTLVGRLRHAEAVKVHGNLPRQEAHALARECRIFAFPTQWPGEGQPAALVEAMGMGLVPVASRWRGVAEIVQDRVNGLLLDTLAPEALAHLIIELLRDGDMLNRLSAQARETIRTQYEAHGALKQYQQIVAEVLCPS
jgi:glycosyltransferase involved in cell wall biosynthesis